MQDHYLTLAEPAFAEFKDRASRFLAFAFPAKTEDECHFELEKLRKEHFKANHHCFAWRLGLDGNRFRSSDDGEPSGTAGRPILAQIDQRGLTNVAVVVVRYFGGTLLGAAGLINAYREATASALDDAKKVERIIAKIFEMEMDYALQPDVLKTIHKLHLTILEEKYTENATIRIGIRSSIAEDLLLRFKSNFLKISIEEALTRDFPQGFSMKKIGEMEV